VSPFGVDVSRGVETAPGIKNHELIRRFVKAARSLNGAMSL
jgi:phosphoribosylanthranilate isomerase